MLESAGYRVLSIGSFTMLLDPIASRFDLVLLCHSVAAERMESIARFLRSSRSTLPLVALTFNKLTPWLDEANLVRTHPAPLPLIRTVDQILQANPAATVHVVPPKGEYRNR